jgi:hypothetical protein
MKRFIIGLTAALALVFVGTARADDTKTKEKSTTEKKTDATKDTAATPQDTGMGGSGSATKSEKKSTHEKESKTDDTKAATPPAK